MALVVARLLASPRKASRIAAQAVGSYSISPAVIATVYRGRITGAWLSRTWQYRR